MFLSDNSLFILCCLRFLDFCGFHGVIPHNILCFNMNMEPKLGATPPSQSIMVLPLKEGKRMGALNLWNGSQTVSKVLIWIFLLF